MNVLAQLGICVLVIGPLAFSAMVLSFRTAAAYLGVDRAVGRSTLPVGRWQAPSTDGPWRPSYVHIRRSLQ